MEPLGTTIAHGYLSLSLIPTLLEELKATMGSTRPKGEIVLLAYP